MLKSGLDYRVKAVMQRYRCKECRRHSFVELED